MRSRTLQGAATVYLTARKLHTLGISILNILMNNPFSILLLENAGLEILVQTTNTFYPRIIHFCYLRGVFNCTLNQCYYPTNLSAETGDLRLCTRG